MTYFRADATSRARTSVLGGDRHGMSDIGASIGRASAHFTQQLLPSALRAAMRRAVTSVRQELPKFTGRMADSASAAVRRGVYDSRMPNGVIRMRGSGLLTRGGR